MMWNSCALFVRQVKKAHGISQNDPIPILCKTLPISGNLKKNSRKF